MNISLKNREFYGMQLKGEKKKKFFEFLSHLTKGQLKFEEVKECLCGNQKAEKIASSDRFGFPVSSYLCNNCGLIYLSPRLTDDSYPLFYDKLYWGLVMGKNSDMDESVLTTGGEGYGGDVAAFVHKFFKDKKALKIAEVGVGNGQKLVSLREHFSGLGISTDLYGCDFSKDAVKACAAQGIKAFEGDVTLLENSGPYDLVIMSHVVEHLNSPINVLKNVSKLIANDGYLYIEVPGVGELDKKDEYQFDFYLYSVIAHTYCFNLQSLKSVVECAGYELIQGTEFARTVFKVNANNAGRYNSNQNNYKQVVEVLERAEKERARFLDNPKARVRNLIKKVTGYEISRG